MQLLDAGSDTTIRVSQAMANLALAPSVAAWCEFYLDRMVASFEGRDPDDLDFDEYFVTQAGHYRQMFPVQSRAAHGVRRRIRSTPRGVVTPLARS